MDMKTAREKIDQIDRQLLPLFIERMKTAGEIGKYKSENSLPVYDPERERSLLWKIAEEAGETFEESSLILYATILSLSRSFQNQLLQRKGTYTQAIRQALENTEKVFPSRARVACQGVEGAYSQIAASRLFSLPSIMYFKGFDGVFSAIESGLCEYGVLPIENSTAGSVKMVYDLMVNHNFFIVKSIRIKIDHNLLAKKGTSIKDIKEIYSHEQAIDQCADFLKSLPGVKVHACENTAMAAKFVAESDRSDIAALSSITCCDMYGLQSIAESVQNQNNNYTRFICISKNMEIYPGADRTSVMLVTAHKPGSLYHILSKINALGLNLLKLESRPMPDRDFEFMFYFDIEIPYSSSKLTQLVTELEEESEQFKYLGTYSESF